MFMAIYKTKWFARWSRKNGLSDSSICAAVSEMTNGLYDANLGGGLYKKRIAKQGQGKSGGFRTLLASNFGNRWFFMYGFEKNQRSNIDKDEEDALKLLAEKFLALSNKEIEQATQSDEFIEVNCNENK
jgi:hypothetical protein